MKILALEFSSPQRSVAVLNARDDPALAVASVSEAIESGGPHASGLDLVESALRQANVEREQIECLAVGTGPGSYTGIRSAIAMAQGWQLARGTKLLGISSAECLAATAADEGLAGDATVIIDAQRQEFYLARYRLGERVRELAPLHIVSLPEVLERQAAGELLVGPEVTRWMPKGRVLFPRAAVLARLALRRTDFVSGEQLEPIYLREPQFVKAPPPRVVPDV